MDFFYVGVGIVFFLVTWALIKLCDNLGNFDSGEKR